MLLECSNWMPAHAGTVLMSANVLIKNYTGAWFHSVETTNCKWRVTYKNVQEWFDSED